MCRPIARIQLKAMAVVKNAGLRSLSFLTCSIRSCCRTNMPALVSAKASTEEVVDLVEAARYGELDSLQQFIAQYGSEQIADSVDEFGLTPLHMAAANGHAGPSSFSRFCLRTLRF